MTGTDPMAPYDGATIVLVGCGNAKRDGTTAAKDLYTSNYFQLKREYAEQFGDLWYILSAEYGLLSPNEVVSTYDTEISDVDEHEWEELVAEDIPNLTGATVEVLAGPDYAEPLKLRLDMYADIVAFPTEGLKIGERMSWLKTQLEADRADPDAPASRPTPPASLPQYVQEGVERQDADTLRELAAWAEQLAAWKDREISADEIHDAASEDETVEDVQDGSSGTIVTKKVPCGKDCNGCPHGPYEYRAYRDGDSVKTEYVGKA